MNRTNRLTAILIHLQSRKIVKAQDIASRFHISLRTVYRDVQALNEAGVPVIGEAGVGYSIMEGYRLPPVMFTSAEATAMLAAEKLVERLTDPVMAEQYRNALYKIRAVMRGADKDQLEVLDENISSLPDPWLPEHRYNHNHTLQDILRAIAAKTILNIRYQKAYDDAQTFRTAEPVGVFQQAGQWYLIAWCRLRGDYRNFKVNRILELQPGAEPFHKQHPTLKQYLKQVKQERELHEVTLLAYPERMKWLGDQKYYMGYVSERFLNGMIEMTFLTASLENFARWYMMVGECGHIISPAHLKTRVKEILGAIAERV